MIVALRFNEKINQQDLDGLVELMTDDHTFIDIPGEITKGKDVMKEGWRNFFTNYPDYRNTFMRVQVEDDLVVMLGYSTCSYKPLDGLHCGARRYVKDAFQNGEYVRIQRLIARN